MSDLRMQQGEQSEPALAEFFRFAEALRLAVFATDARTDGAIVRHATQTLGELSGRTSGEVIGLGLTAVLGSLTWGSGRSDLAEAELRHADGHAIPVSLTVRLLEGEVAAWLWFVFARDPSTRSMAALAQQLVHEVSNPLTSVVCRLDLVARQLPQLVIDEARGEDLGRHVASAQHGAERVVTLVRQFADSLDRTPADSASPSPTLPPSSHRRSIRRD